MFLSTCLSTVYLAPLLHLVTRPAISCGRTLPSKSLLHLVPPACLPLDTACNIYDNRLHRNLDFAADTLSPVCRNGHRGVSEIGLGTPLSASTLVSLFSSFFRLLFSSLLFFLFFIFFFFFFCFFTLHRHRSSVSLSLSLRVRVKRTDFFRLV